MQLPNKKPTIDRVEARELARGMRIMVATGGYSRLTDVSFRGGKILVSTETGEQTLMDPATLVAVQR